DQVIQRLRPKVAQVEGAKFFMQSGQDISIGGRLSRTQYQYTLTDTDSGELNHWAPIVEGAMQKLPQLQDVASDQQIAAPHVAVEIDRDAASRLGISPSLIDETLYDAFGQRQIATMYTATNQYKVILEVKPEFQTDPTAPSWAPRRPSRPRYRRRRSWWRRRSSSSTSCSACSMRATSTRSRSSPHCRRPASGRCWR